MNEAETRAELIDPKLKDAGWGVVEGSKVLREYRITKGKIQTGNTNSSTKGRSTRGKGSGPGTSR